PGEDVQDEPGAVDDLHGELLAQVAALRGGEVVVQEEERGLLLARERLHLVDLALAEEGGSPDGAAPLQHFAAHLRPGRLGEETQLGQTLLAVQAVPLTGLATRQDGALPKRARSPARRGHS